MERWETEMKNTKEPGTRTTKAVFSKEIPDFKESIRWEQDTNVQPIDLTNEKVATDISI